MPLALYALTAGAFDAFTLGAAIGAWSGGLVIDHGPGLAAAPLSAAFFPLAAIVVAGLAVNQDRAVKRVAC